MVGNLSLQPEDPKQQEILHASVDNQGAPSVRPCQTHPLARISHFWPLLLPELTQKPPGIFCSMVVFTLLCPPLGGGFLLSLPQLLW